MGFHTYFHIERVHLQYCKKLLGVKKSTQSDFVYGELGRLPFQYIRYYHVIRYWVKLIHTSDDKYCKKVYTMLKDDIEERPYEKLVLIT